MQQCMSYNNPNKIYWSKVKYVYWLSCRKYPKFDKDKDPKFEVGNALKIFQYKKFFAKSYAPNCS